MKIKKISNERYISNHISITNPSKRKEVAEDITNYLENGFLRIPNASVFANINQNAHLLFEFDEEKFALDDFLVNVISDLFVAHKYSYAENNYTVRLNDAHYNPESHEITLFTRPTTYYNMLLTNRCMDFELARGVTIRNMFEYREKISTLRSSTLSNQIGINGLIITSDGYLLLERRTRKKTTWKNKYAQPISLSMKFSDLASYFETRSIRGEDEKYVDHICQKIDDKYVAESMFKDIIKKTVKSNYGIKEDQYEFHFSKNFMGIARDLVEGGKPNFYFYIVLKKNAEETRKIIQKASAVSEYDNRKSEEEKAEGMSAISRGKLDSFYYLVRYEDLFVNHQSAINIKNKNTLWVRRRLTKHFYWFTAMRNYLYYHLIERHFFTKKKAGDALLACLAYLEIIQPYIDNEAIKKVSIKRKGG